MLIVKNSILIVLLICQIILGSITAAFCADASQYQSQVLRNMVRLYNDPNADKENGKSIVIVLGSIDTVCSVAEQNGQGFVNQRTGEWQPASVRISIALQPLSVMAADDPAIQDFLPQNGEKYDYMVIRVKSPISTAYYLPYDLSFEDGKGWIVKMTDMKVGGSFPKLYGDTNNADNNDSAGGYDTISFTGGLSFYPIMRNVKFSDSRGNDWFSYNGCQSIGFVQAAEVVTIARLAKQAGVISN